MALTYHLNTSAKTMAVKAGAGPVLGLQCFKRPELLQDLLALKKIKHLLNQEDNLIT